MLAGPGSLAGRLALAGLLIAQGEVALGPDGAARNQQRRVVGDDRVGVDDAKVHPGHPPWVQIVVIDGDGGGDGQPQPSSIGHQGDRPDLVGRVGKRAGQPHPQRRTASSHRQPHPPAVRLEGAVAEADRHQTVLFVSGRSPRCERSRLVSSNHAHTSPAERSSP